MATPASTIVATSLSTKRITRERSAPSAIRTPISLRRRATLYAMIPYRPIVARITASAPKKPDKVAIDRMSVSDRESWSSSVVKSRVMRGFSAATAFVTTGTIPAGDPVVRSSYETPCASTDSWPRGKYMIGCAESRSE